jgi:ferredoxin
MKSKDILRIGIQLTAIIAAVILLSLSSVRFKGQKEEGSKKVTLVISDTMTVAQFATVNNIPKKKLKEIWGLSSKEDLKKNITQFGLTRDQIVQKITKQMALSAEYESRNWIIIPLKFALTIAMLVIVFILLRRGKITSKLRKIILSVSALVFGVVLGSDPNAMGTVKDAIVLFGAKHIIFPPRLIAFTVFLIMVVVANKFICSWACQFGVLQDLLFRLGHSKDENSLIPQFKVPFVISNTIRVVFFLIFTFFAFAFSFDIVGKIDPFKIYNPAKLGLLGGVFTGVILITSLFVYRPWCHFFCPFGLVGWLAEKVSFFKIKVNYSTCIACHKCEKACPSTVMGAILKRDKVIPDCFSCGVCTEVCPTKSISFSKGKRTIPPEGKFSQTGALGNTKKHLAI